MLMKWCFILLQLTMSEGERTKSTADSTAYGPGGVDPGGGSGQKSPNGGKCLLVL